MKSLTVKETNFSEHSSNRAQRMIYHSVVVASRFKIGVWESVTYINVVLTLN